MRLYSINTDYHLTLNIPSWHVFSKIYNCQPNIVMKKLLAYALITILLSSFTSSSVQDVINALKTGNAALVSKYFDNTIDITLSDKSNSYSRSQAELVLKDFFNTNEVKNFNVIHTGDNAGSQYCIGTLQTKNGTFRTTIYMKQKGDKQVLQELKFEK